MRPSAYVPLYQHRACLRQRAWKAHPCLCGLLPWIFTSFFVGPLSPSCYCHSFLDGSVPVLLLVIALLLGWVPCPALPTVHQNALLLIRRRLLVPNMTETSHTSRGKGWQGGILPTSPPQLSSTNLLHCVRAAFLPNCPASLFTIGLVRP